MSSKCNMCDKPFKTKGKLDVHLKTHGQKKVQFCCPVCGNMLASNQGLLRHLRIHSGTKPFKCKLCDKEFTQSTSLKTHARTHTRETPFGCETCSKSFSDRSNLGKT